MSIWNFMKEMNQLQTQLNELTKAKPFGSWPRIAFLPGLSGRHFPLLNLSTDEENVVVEALAPGLAPDSLKVSAVRDKLTITGEKAKAEVADEKFHRNERSAGKFTRTIEMPVFIEPDMVSADYTNGILKIVLPKAEESKPRQIDIKIS